MKKTRLLYFSGCMFIAFVYAITVYLICRTYIISEFYLHFTVCIIVLLIFLFAVYCLIKRKCSYLYLLCIGVLCALSASVCTICKFQVESSFKTIASCGSTIYFETHNFPQSEVRVKIQTTLCFAQSCGKVIIPKGAEHQITTNEDMLIITMIRNDEKIRYYVNMKKNKITELIDE